MSEGFDATLKYQAACSGIWWLTRNLCARCDDITHKEQKDTDELFLSLLFEQLPFVQVSDFCSVCACVRVLVLLCVAEGEQRFEIPTTIWSTSPHCRRGCFLLLLFFFFHFADQLCGTSNTGPACFTNGVAQSRLLSSDMLSLLQWFFLMPIVVTWMGGIALPPPACPPLNSLANTIAALGPRDARPLFCKPAMRCFQGRSLITVIPTGVEDWDGTLRNETFSRREAKDAGCRLQVCLSLAAFLLQPFVYDSQSVWYATCH